MSSVASLPPRTKQEQIKPPVDKSRIAASEAEVKAPKEEPSESASSEKVSTLPSTSLGGEGSEGGRREIVTA